MTLRRFLLLTIIASWFGVPAVFGQINGQKTITTAVPFLTISPDSRSAAMGDAGAALSPDANSIYWNPAKLAFSEKRWGASVSYNPWLRTLVNDMALSYLAGYRKFDDDKQAVGLGIQYFDLGTINFTDNSGNSLGDGTPREVAITASYARQLGREFSMAVNLRYINSNLNGYNDVVGVGVRPGSTAAGDIAAYYTKDKNWGGKDVNLALGAVISNLGGKIAYSNVDGQRDFIPTNLKLGSALTYNVDVYNKFTFALDVNKLMVPTPDTALINGRIVNVNANKSFVSGVFGSFSDAPGGISEELQELSLSAGLEYWYNDFFAVRGGYFTEHRQKGDRKYITTGLGVRYG
ncbi:MAG: type IX secretion system outer membrane channel protein PorV, partial [Ferruginibacter sp.]|nr:type IX secretion system outer membrane channel protein PorV [Cytophagales bacterium]